MSEETFYFNFAKDQDLPKADIRYKVKQMDGKCEITLSSKQLCPVAGSPGSGTFIAIVIELGFFTTNATSILLAFSGMYLNHNRGISKHSNFINTSVLDI